MAFSIYACITVTYSSCFSFSGTRAIEALGKLIDEYIANPMAVLANNAQQTYFILDPILMLDGDNTAILVLAPSKQTSSSGFVSRETGVVREIKNAEYSSDLRSPAIALSEQLMTTAHSNRLRLTRGNQIAVIYVTSRLEESLKRSRRVYIAEDYFISEEGFRKRFGRTPHEQYSIEYTQTGEWRVTRTDSNEDIIVKDDQVDSYILNHGAPWSYIKLAEGWPHDKRSSRYYQVKTFGINHKIELPSDIISANSAEVIGIFTEPAFRGSNFIEGNSVIDLLSVLLPKAPNSTDGEDAMHELLPNRI